MILNSRGTEEDRKCFHDHFKDVFVFFMFVTWT